jgi:WD40 repeat protein
MLALIDSLIRLLQDSEGKSSTGIQTKLDSLQALFVKLDDVFKAAELAITGESISSRKQRIFFSHFLQYNHPKVNKAQQTLTQLIDDSTAGKLLSVTNLERLRRIIGRLRDSLNGKVNDVSNSKNSKSKASVTVINSYLEQFIACIETPLEQATPFQNDIDEKFSAENLESTGSSVLPKNLDESKMSSLYLAIQLATMWQSTGESENVEALVNQSKHSAQDQISLTTPKRTPEPGSSTAHATTSSNPTQHNTLSHINAGNNSTFNIGNTRTIGTQHIQNQINYLQPPSTRTSPAPTQESSETDKAIRVYNLVACLHKYFKKQMKIQRDSPTLKALKNYYIEQQYSLDISATAPKILKDHITTWLRESAPPTLLILGEAGGGKSLLTQDWEQRLWTMLEPELHAVPPEQSREAYVRSRKITSALLYHQQQWWLGYQQGEKIKQVNTCSLPPYPFVQRLLRQSYQSLLGDFRQRKKINQGIQYYWLCQQKSHLPIRISLGDYSAETVLKCVETHLEMIFRHECLELEKNDLFALRKAVRFLCLFDAYDEIKSTEDQFEQNLYRSNELQHNTAKALFTCRSQYFDTLQQSNLCFNSGNTEVAPKVYLTQFKFIDIQAYIELYAAVNHLDNKDAILTSLTDNHYLKELLATPLMLNLYMESYAPGQQPRNRWELYQRLMQGLFERQSSKSNSPSSADNIKLEYEDASAELAFTLYVENIDVIAKPTQLSKRRQKRRANSPQAETPIATFFSKEAIQTQLRCGHPFKLTATSKYGFIHESFKEFFIAKYLLADLEDAVEFESAQDTWNAKLLPQKPVILRFLREGIEAQNTEAQHRLKTYLWYWVTLKAAEYSNCSANSATLLVQLGKSFSNKDLSGTHLSGAILSGGMFDSTNFTDADCSGVNFSQAWLRRANFTHADLRDTEWGEYPKLELGGGVKAMYSDVTGIIQIAVVAGANIYLCCSATGERLATLRGHTGTIRCLSYSADGLQLASGSDDGTICLWNIARRCQEATLEGQTGRIWCLSYSADGLQLASGSDDHTIRLWNLARRCQEATLEGHTNRILCLSYSADGLQLASGGFDNTIRLWNVARRCREATLEGYAGTIRCLSYSADGLQLASGSGDSTIRLWIVARRRQEATLERHTDEVSCLSYSADGLQLASGSEDGTICLWNVVRRCQEATLEGHTDEITYLSYSANGLQLASGSRDHTMRLWNVARRCQEATLEGHTSSVLCLSYSADGLQLASGSEDDTIRLWNVARRCQEATLEEANTHGVHCLSYSADGLQLASGSYRTIHLWDVTRRCQEATLEGHTHWVECLSFSADGLQLASGGWNNGTMHSTIRLWNIARRCQEATFEEQTGRIWCLSYSADGLQLASGSSDSTIRLWNVARQCQEATLMGHRGSVRCLSYSADGLQLASGSYDNTLRIWNVERRCSEATLEGHRDMVSCLSYNPDGLQLASGSYDNTLRIWDLRKYVCLQILSLHRPIQALAWHAEHIALGCEKEIVHMRTPKDCEPGSWYAMWRAALSPVLCCNDLNFSGAVCDAITKRLLHQHGGVDSFDSSVTSAISADCSPSANFVPNIPLNSTSVDLVNSKNKTDPKPEKHKQPEVVKNPSPIMDDGKITDAMACAFFSSSLMTKGGGDCALHAVFGHLSSGQYICDDVEQKRKDLSKSVSICAEHSELHRLVCTSIEALIMERRRVPGAASLQALQERYEQFSNENDHIQSDAWQQFNLTLQHYGKVMEHIDNFVDRYINISLGLTQQNIHLLRTSHKEAFSTCLQEEDNRVLEVLIHSIPSLRDAYQTYRAAMSVGFTWEFQIDRAVIQDYANFIGTPGVWLLPSELHIIATVFEIRIDYYLTASALNPDVFYPAGHPRVAVQFNGVDHYERRAEDENLPTLSHTL